MALDAAPKHNYSSAYRCYVSLSYWLNHWMIVYATEVHDLLVECRIGAFEYLLGGS
jgi:hypothetical protein